MPVHRVQVQPGGRFLVTRSELVEPTVLTPAVIAVARAICHAVSAEGRAE
jgi:hypothetical protein